MRRLLLVLLVLTSLAASAWAAAPTSAVVSVPTAPTIGAACSYRAVVVAESNGHQYRCLAGKWIDQTSQTLLEALINAGTIDGDLTVTGRVVSPTAQVGKIDFTTQGYGAAGIQASQGGFSATVSGGPRIDWGLDDLNLGTYRAGGVVGLWSDTAVRIEAPAITSGAYTTGGTLGKRSNPWAMAYVSGLDLNADGTADISWDATEGVVSIAGHPTHPLLRVMIPMPGATSGTTPSVTTWTIGATAVASSWGNGVGRGSWRMAAGSNPSAIGTTLMVPSGWTSGRLDLQGVWQSASGEAVGLTAAWRLAAVCAPVLAAGTTTSYTGATTAGTRAPSDVWGINTMALTLTIPNVATNCPAGSGLTVYLQRLPNDSLDTLVNDADVLGAVVALW